MDRLCRRHALSILRCFCSQHEMGQIYDLDASGPDIENDHCFNEDEFLLDGLAFLVLSGYDRKKTSQSGKNTASVMKSLVAAPAAYDEKGDRKLSALFLRTLLYKMHAKGFTANANPGVIEKKRNTFHGIIEKTGYLKKGHHSCWNSACLSI